MVSKRKRRRLEETQRQPDVPLFEAFSVEAILPPSQPYDGQTPTDRLNAVCLEVCQQQPFGSTPENKLVSQSTKAERKMMLELAVKAGLDVEGLVKIIRGSHGVQSKVFDRLSQLKNKPQ
jgi:hypothetical protein